MPRSKPCGTWQRTGVPEDKVGRVVALYNRQGALTVTPQKQADGTWTVTAVFPPCLDGLARTTVQEHAD